VYVTEHAAVELFCAVRAQLLGEVKALPAAALKVPLLGLTLQITEPVGAVFVPLASVSVIVAVQVVPLLTVTVLAAQLTPLLVDRRFTVTVKAVVVLLALWGPSPP
jgi:hypothetical protein